MRILHVVPFFTPRMGGAAQAAFSAARRLGRNGHAVTVLTSDYERAENEFADESFRTVALPSVFSRWGFYFTPALPAWVRAHLREYDVIHMHTFRTYQNIVLQPLALRNGIPYVVSAHGTLPVLFQRKLAKRGFDLLFGRALLGDASRYVAVSPVEVEQYRRAGAVKEKIRLVYNGIDEAEFAHLPRRYSFRKKFPGIQKDARLVLFLGRLHPSKEINLLIEAFSRLLPVLDGCLLLIAGPDDGEQARLRELTVRLGLNGKVWFVGPQYGPDRLAALADADVLVAPAANEIFGFVPFEALLCGTPVVVTAASGAGQIIGAAQAGFLFPPGDSLALADAIFQTFTHPRKAARMADAGRAFVRKQLSDKKMAADLEKVYAEVIAESR